jgi:hypothetical protein
LQQIMIRKSGSRGAGAKHLPEIMLDKRDEIMMRFDLTAS